MSRKWGTGFWLLCDRRNLGCICIDWRYFGSGKKLLIVIELLEQVTCGKRLRR